jgi:hypothetical protein
MAGFKRGWHGCRILAGGWKRLYYLNNIPARNEMQVMAVPVTPSPSFSSNPAELLFRVSGRNLRPNFSVNRDGMQFLLVLPENASLIAR